MSIEFNSSPGPSVGVEVELEIVDRETGALVSCATEILEEMGRPFGDAGHPKAKHELFECTIEMITGICQSPAGARADLTETLAEIRTFTDPLGLDLMCSGTHPFSHWTEQVVSPDPRYGALVDAMGWMARRLQIFGVHVHVGIRSPERCIAIANALSSSIPHFLALSSSSPFWEGNDTGLASCRSKVFEGLPTAGLPEPIDSWEEFETFMSTLVAAEAIGTVREVWWDIRPHPDFGTIELRMCDGIPSLADVTAIAALSQCLVVHLDRRFDDEGGLDPPAPWLLRQNKWRAARHGLDAEFIVDESGRCIQAVDAIAELVTELSPTADELGCSSELDGITSLLERGTSAEAQRRVFRETGDLTDVVRHLVGELERP
ncbi:MAG TPA: glutamate--cysteine ligase [Acidimicrobiales bacterium]|nr:glutamate--cysteine ligase [Acidimicrobiales bacterium]